MQTALSTPSALPVSGIAASFHAPSVVRYCAVALYFVGKADPVWLQDDGQIVIFDTKVCAQDLIGLMAEGRDITWEQNGEDATFWPLYSEVGKCNRALVVTGYDVYNVPAGHAVKSETKGKAWKHHILWGHWFRGVKGVS